MKCIIHILLVILITASCTSRHQSGSNQQAIDYWHEIATFTADSLVNVVIEIPAGCNQKWELNKSTGQIEWEEISPDSLRVIDYLPYPANYGFVPQTIVDEATGGDGDPLDVFVLGSSIARGTMCTVRIIGVIMMLDDGEQDAKLLAVDVNSPHFRVTTYNKLIAGYPGLVDIITVWLLNYKGTKSVEIVSLNDENEALRILRASHYNYILKKEIQK